LHQIAPLKSSPPIYETASFVINVNQTSSQADQQTRSRTRQDENGSVFIEREVRRQLASEATPPEQVHPIPPTAGFLDRSAVEMLGLDPVEVQQVIRRQQAIRPLRNPA